MALENEYVTVDTTLTEMAGVVDSMAIVRDNLDGSNVVLVHLSLSNLEFNPTSLNFRTIGASEAIRTIRSWA